MQQLATDGTATSANAPSASGVPTSMSSNPLHSKTESTLAPTSEFTRLLLLALVSRYVLRGAIGEFFDARTFKSFKEPANGLLDKLFVGKRADALNGILGKYEGELKSFAGSPQEFLRSTETGKKLYAELRPELRKWRIDASKEIPQIVGDARNAFNNGTKTFMHDKEHATSWGRLRDHIRERMDDIFYAGSLAVGGAWLSVTYSNLVRADIKNIFSETVAYEKGTTPDKVKFEDISASNNKIIQKTVHNYWAKLGERLVVDAMFIPAAFSKSMHVTDFVLGVKGAQALTETWKRKPTLFEDLVTVVNNKINPRNGLGQPVTVGEVFDLYQHYTEQFSDGKMFNNVVERGTGEGAVWAVNQPIFQRMAELMNLTYAYKHASVLDASGRAVHQADFPLPKLIYLLGHDLIDTHNPVQTLAYIEVANLHGMEAVKDMQAQLSQGQPLEIILQKYPVPQLDKAKAAQQPVIEGTNSITKIFHADKAEVPATTIAAPRELLENTISPELVAQAAI